MVIVLTVRAKEDGQVGDLIPHLMDCGVSVLQYTNDSIVFMEHNM